MTFPRNKPVPVQYLIDLRKMYEGQESSKPPKGIYPNIKKQHSQLDIGCPAIAATNNKLFDVPSPFTFDLIFGRDEFGDSYWRYTFDTKVHRDFTPSIHDILKYALTNSETGGKSIQMQFGVPYALMTDTPDTSLTILPPHNIKYENCAFVTGEFVFTDWVRHLSSAWVLLDESKPAVVHYEIGEPCMSLYFNKQVELSFVENTQKALDYIDQNVLSTFYLKNAIESMFATVKSRRPKKLLVRNGD